MNRRLCDGQCRWGHRYAIGIAMLLMAVVTPAFAIQPHLPTCEMQYPTLRRMSLDKLIGLLRTGLTRKSQCAMAQLPKFGTDAVEPLIGLLRSDREQERISAAYGLSYLGEDALPAVPALASRLDDPSPEVRRGVLSTLSWLHPRSRELTLALIERLDRLPPGSPADGDLVEAISRVGTLPPEALAPLTKTLSSLPDFDRRAAGDAIDAISHVKSPQAIMTLALLVGDRSEDRSWHATEVLGQFGFLAVPALLVRRLDESNRRAWPAIEHALNLALLVAVRPAMFEYYQADTTLLVRQLRDPSPTIRLQALAKVERLASAFHESSSDLGGAKEMALPDEIMPIPCVILDALKERAAHATNPGEQLMATRTISRITSLDLRYNYCDAPLY